MITADIKGLLTRFNPYCGNVLHSAAGLCVARTHYEVTVEHFFRQLLEDANSDFSIILRKNNIDPGKLMQVLDRALEDFRDGNSSKPAFSPLLLELVQDAWVISSIDLGEKTIRSGAVLLAFLGKPTLFASGRYGDVLSAINRENLLNNFFTITAVSVESKTAEKSDSSAASSDGAKQGGYLDKYCIDFTKKAEDGGIDPVFGRDAEIRQIVDILARRRKNNPICVGEPGVGKTAVVEGLALRITEDDVPDVIKGVSLLGLDMGLLEAGAGMKGEFEKRLKGVIDEIKSSEKPIILFIDEAHTLIGAGGSAGGADAANLLKPALARGELRTVAATTWSEYKKYFEKDPALARRFQPVKLDEPSVENSALILRGLKEGYEKAHGVIVTDEAVAAAAELADKYITGRFLPDKAIDLLDTSCARIKINLTAKPGVLEDKERALQALERNENAILRDLENGLQADEEELNDIKEKKKSLKAEADKICAKWEKEKAAAEKILEIRKQLAQDGADVKKLKADMKKASAELVKAQGDEPLVFTEVSTDSVAQVVSDWTGIPLGRLQRDEAATIKNLADKLKERIKGQETGLEIIAEVIQAAKSGIKNPEQPLGVFLLVGPSGVGKTETGLSLAELLFGGERHVVTINMSEFQESHTVSRLIGSPPGYVGYGEGGMLTEAVRQKPYSVVLLDEVEKAHPDVMNLFYQVLDKGMLTDGEGKEINFRNTIIMLTSNLASDITQEMTADGDEIPLDAVLSAVRPVLSKHFKPALLARMTIVPYVSLNKDALKNIVHLKVDKLRNTLMRNNKMHMTVTDKVIEQITDRCKEVETGARNIDYILNGNVLPQLSKTILEHMTEGSMPEHVTIDADKDGNFTTKFK